MHLSIRLVALLEDRADLLALRWRQAVQKNRLTPRYAELEPLELERRAKNVFSSIGRWLDKSFSRDQARNTYYSLGRRRYQEGFSVVELVTALSLEKQVLWDLMEEECPLETSYEKQAALELLVSTAEFFDKALIYALSGYEFEQKSGERGKRKVHPTSSWFVSPES